MKLIDASIELPPNEAFGAEPKLFVLRLTKQGNFLYSPASKINVDRLANREGEKCYWGSMDELTETLKNDSFSAVSPDAFKTASENEKLKRRIAALETRLAATRKLLTQALDSTNEY